MMRIIAWRQRSAMLVVSLLTVVTSGTATAAQIAERAGAFQACLDARFETWVNAQAELVVNEDPKASVIDDAGVAKWATDTLGSCRSQAGREDRKAEEQFAKHMARWRDHIYERVRAIQERTKPD